MIQELEERKCESDFFENIDSEEKAYFLGFLMADGNVYVRKQSQPCIRLEISVKDLEILERFKVIKYMLIPRGIASQFLVTHRG